METDPGSQPRNRAPLALFGVAAIIVAADQTTKALAVAKLEPGRTVPVIDGVLHWTLQRNPGAAFSLFAKFPVVFTILAAAISIVIVARARTVRGRLTAIGLGLVLGGALGNLVDRIARPPALFRGHVIDFIDFRVWPVFNIADAGVVCGAIILVVVALLDDRRKKRHA